MGVVSDSLAHYGEDVYAAQTDRPERSIGLILDVPKKASLIPCHTKQSCARVGDNYRGCPGVVVPNFNQPLLAARVHPLSRSRDLSHSTSVVVWHVYAL